MPWTENIAGTPWDQPGGEDTLKAKADELGISIADTTVTAFNQHRYVIGRDGSGKLVILLATADDSFGLFDLGGDGAALGGADQFFTVAEIDPVFPGAPTSNI